MITSGGKNALGTCYGIISLAGGQLSLIASAPFTEQGNPPVTIAIVGGTGVYEGASGSIHSVSRGNTYTNDTVHVILPS